MNIDIATDASQEVANLVRRVDSFANENISWYQRKKRWERCCFYIAGAGSILAGSLVPVLNVLLDEHARFATAICGGVVVLTTSFSGFFRWQLNWTNYSAAQDQIESIHRKWYSQLDRMYEVGNEAARLERTRRICDRLVSQIETIRKAETSVTLVSPTSTSDNDNNS